MKLKTVSVIEYIGTGNVSVHSFPDTKDGNRDAESLFSAIIKENSDWESDDKIKTFLEDGFYSFGEFEIYLVYSEE